MVKIYTVGEKVDNFCLQSPEGKKCLYDFLGKWVVVYFYPKDDTPGCTTEALEFTQLLEEFNKLNAVVLGISKDPVESHSKFALKYKLRVILLSDVNKEILKKFGVIGIKRRFGREYEGVIRSTFILNPKMEIVWEARNVKAEGHARKVLEVLKALVKEYQGDYVK